MQHLIDFIAVILAADAITSAWFYGSIFEDSREFFAKQKGLLAELMSCTFCLPYHICFWTIVLLWATAQTLPEHLAIVPRSILYTFAATDAVHWLQGERPIPYEETDEQEPG
jgi:hypothetical protein